MDKEWAANRDQVRAEMAKGEARMAKSDKEAEELRQASAAWFKNTGRRTSLPKPSADPTSPTTTGPHTTDDDIPSTDDSPAGKAWEKLKALEKKN